MKKEMKGLTWTNLQIHHSNIIEALVDEEMKGLFYEEEKTHL